MKTLKQVEGKIFEELKAFMEKQTQFKMKNITYKTYEKGLFKYMAFSEETNERAIIKLDPYTGQVMICFESDKEQNYHIGYLTDSE
ncbi:hypothetical protein [Bacillus pseudomycoides]|uniref:hypothetical protein n=1 Tax=Bacillus pseudomycoides TaxID=64104 RepID=UPI000BEDE545|nr:hypothetical protein [Bacillus pseudomycoides]PEB42248.1 hypothetical protein COO06_08025 [Bacillus pseudomycoides]PEM69327.1 hypothetical protein CN619_21565 [Bacillus pseudomycoides]PGA62207.1 hypothetical protein COL84_13625 [Bacillus pseudomycoides]